jgi:hypothetical protein
MQMVRLHQRPQRSDGFLEVIRSTTRRKALAGGRIVPRKPVLDGFAGCVKEAGKLADAAEPVGCTPKRFSEHIVMHGWEFPACAAASLYGYRHSLAAPRPDGGRRGARGMKIAANMRSATQSQASA